jgi:hypothetical protein
LQLLCPLLLTLLSTCSKEASLPSAQRYPGRSVAATCQSNAPVTLLLAEQNVLHQAQQQNTDNTHGSVCKTPEGANDRQLNLLRGLKR